jgi:hypothetical protein
MEQFRLPGGELTSDHKLWTAEWKAISDAIEKKLDCEVFGFDPFIYARPKGDVNDTAIIPMWLVRKILVSVKD